MASSRWLLFLLFIVPLALDHLVAPTKAQDYGECNDPKFCWKCTNRDESDTIFQQNLNTLLSTFSSNISNSGFYNSSFGQDSEKVNAIALCRGDIDNEECRTCVGSSVAVITGNCSGHNDAILWSEACMLRYSQTEIFGVVDEDPVRHMHNSYEPSSNSEAFYLVLYTVLDNLTERAADLNYGKKYAAGHASVNGGDDMIYALVQCTPDIDKGSCTRCLNQSISEIQQCCDKNRGARILKPSCNLRYEDFMFYATRVDVEVDVSAALQVNPATPENPAPRT